MTRQAVSSSLDAMAIDRLDQAETTVGAGPVRRQISGTELRVHPLALGCNAFGWTATGEASIAILDAHQGLGGNFLDTADSFAAGRSEVIIGSWLRSRGARAETVLATKIGRNLDNPGLTQRSIVGAVEASLVRLGTDYLDLLYFHLDDKTVPLEESLVAVDALVRAGKVRYLGASNFAADRLMEARVLSALGLPKFVAVETPYNLVHRAELEKDVAVVARAQHLALMPGFALAHGFLAGAFRTKADAAGTARGQLAAVYLNRRSRRVLAVVDRIAAANAVAPASIALAWLLARPDVVAPVAGAGRADQVHSLVAAAGIRLGRNDLLDLDRVSAY
ncbi:MAG: aldo/keto reductase [Cryobacterium sp.]|uniref:aldo/keto reductase n=1 Tax=unclassified Cryobacterium TaxID=2649013 RepID=UPI0018CB3264|nr:MULTISPECIES: aldo/keto reductase [unclassified Cryobacterium]MCY7405738.1 aldo/keto reductase [Cryobacterium sp.]MEC5155166.1 aryl-alcohol dehydrogenase-like predicted oxidoreductase [Cryobacterium sp. CAN_C3]